MQLLADVVHAAAEGAGGRAECTLLGVSSGPNSCWRGPHRTRSHLMWSAVNGRSGLEEGKVSQATRSVEKARWRFVDRALSHGFRAVVCGIWVAAVVGLSGLASIALSAPGALDD